MELIMLIGAFCFVILVMRFVGAWMLRIDEVIKELKQVNKNFVQFSKIYKTFEKNKEK